MDNKKIKGDGKMKDRLTHENGEGFINCDNCTKPHCNECEEFKAQAKRLAYFENAQQNKALAINCAGLNSFAVEVHKNAALHGWWEEECSVPEILMLCVSELGEALEEYRNGNLTMYFNCELDGVSYDDECNDSGRECYYKLQGKPCEKSKPAGIAVELADCIIRILDYCGAADIDIEKAISLKHEYNKTRPYRHGGKKC